MAFVSKIGNILKQQTQSSSASVSGSSLFHAIRCFSTSTPTLFVGGLHYATDENSLREHFQPYGDLIEARLIIDRASGRSRGFGFISFTSPEEASAAIQALDGKDLHGRTIRVAYAADQKRTNRGPSFRSGGGGGGGWGGNYAAGSGNDVYGNSEGGNTGAYDSSSYGNPNVSSFEGVGSGGNLRTNNMQNHGYSCGNAGPNNGHGTHDLSDRAGGFYGNYSDGYNSGIKSGEGNVGNPGSNGGYSSGSTGYYNSGHGNSNSGVKGYGQNEW